MIQLNNQTRQQKRRAERVQVKSTGISTQQLLNSLLWKMIMEKGGTLDLPTTDMKDVPQNFAFNMQVKGGRITVIAGTQSPFKKEIIT